MKDPDTDTPSEVRLWTPSEVASPPSTATVHPHAGMLVSAWTVDGIDVLVQLARPEDYATDATFTGMPLMYPWANRLDGFWQSAAGRRVDLPADPRLVIVESSGLPLHGAHPALLEFDVIGHDASSVSGRLAWDRPDQLALIASRHSVEMSVALRDRSIQVTTTVRAGSDPLPVSFGLHPYLWLDSPPDQWRLVLPERTPVEVDDRNIPTGELAPRRPTEVVRVRDNGLDHGFVDLRRGARFTLFDDDRSVTLTLGEGYSCAQVYAPLESAYVCLEPMTARANAVQTDDVQLVPPGAAFTASCDFSVATSGSPTRGPGS